DDVRIAREVLVLELQGWQVWCDVGQPRDGRQRKAGRRHLKGEVFTDEPGQLGLVVEDVRGRRHAACAVTQQEYGQPRMSRFGKTQRGGDIAGPVLEVVDDESLPFRLAATTKVERIHRESARGELLGGPPILTAMGIEAVADHDDGSRRPLR